MKHEIPCPVVQLKTTTFMENIENPSVIRTPHVNAKINIDKNGAIEVAFYETRGVVPIGSVIFTIAGDRRKNAGDLVAWMFNAALCRQEPPLKSKEITLATVQEITRAQVDSYEISPPPAAKKVRNVGSDRQRKRSVKGS